MHFFQEKTQMSTLVLSILLKLTLFAANWGYLMSINEKWYTNWNLEWNYCRRSVCELILISVSVSRVEFIPKWNTNKYKDFEEHIYTYSMYLP